MSSLFKNRFLPLAFQAVCLFFSLAAHAQVSADSLAAKWEAAQLLPNYKQDTSVTLLLNELAKKYVYTNTDSAILFAQKSIDLAEAQSYRYGKAWALNTIGVAWYINGSYNLSLKAFLQSKEIFQELNNHERVTWAKNNIALIYIAQEKFDLAIREYRELASSRLANHDSSFLATALFNLGLSYDHNGDRKMAIDYLQQSFNICEENGLNGLLAICKNRLGEVYYKNEDYQKATAYHLEVINDSTVQSIWEKSFAHAGLAQVFLAMNNTEKAIDHGIISLELAEEVGAKWDGARVLDILAKAYAAESNYEQAYHYHKLFKQYSDSLYSKAKEKELNYLHLKQQEAENLQLAKQNEINQQKIQINKMLNIGIGILSIFLSILAFLAHRNNKQKSKLNIKLLKKNADVARQNKLISDQKAKLESLNQTKDKLFSVISHDLKSPLSSITGTLDIVRRGALSEEEQQQIFQALHHKVFMVTQMLNNLLQWANTQQTGIIVRADLFDVTQVTEKILSVANFIANEKSIVLKNDYEKPVYIHADENHLRIILQNLIGNAIKFTSDGGNITVSYPEDEEYQHISIKDNGIGIPKEKLEKLFSSIGANISELGTNEEYGTGIGLMLAQQFIKENDGKLTIQSQLGEGTEVFVSFRKPSKDFKREMLSSSTKPIDN